MPEVQEVQPALHQLVSAGLSLSSAVRALEGPVDLEIKEASDNCWQFQTSTAQVGNGLFQKRRAVEFKEAVLDQSAVDNGLKVALSDWRAAFESSVASSALELQINRHRLSHAVKRFISDKEVTDEDLLTLLDSLLTALRDLQSQPSVHDSTVVFIQSLCEQCTNRLLHRASETSEESALESLVGLSLSYISQAPFLAGILRPRAQDVPAFVKSIIHPRKASGSSDEGDGKTRYEAQAVLLSILPWQQFLTDASVSAETVLGTVQGIALLLRDVLQADELERKLLALTQIFQVLRTVVVNSLCARDLAFSTIIIGLIALMNGHSFKAVLKELSSESDDQNSGYSTPRFAALKFVQAVWAKLAPQNADLVFELCKHVGWSELMPLLPGHLKLPVLLTLAAMMRLFANKTPSNQMTAFVWEVVAPSEATQLSQESLDEAHLICMTQAPAIYGEVAAFWAWLRIKLALNLLRSEEKQSNVGEEIPAPEIAGLNTKNKSTPIVENQEGEFRGRDTAERAQAGEESSEEGLQSEALPPIVSKGGKIEEPSSSPREESDERDPTIIDSMQFWSLFDALITANKGRICIELLLQTYKTLSSSYLRNIAGVLSNVLLETPAKADTLLQPVRLFLQFNQAAEIGSKESVKDDSAWDDSASKRLQDWLRVLCFCVGMFGVRSEPTARLLNDVIHAVYVQPLEHHSVFDTTPSKERGDICGDYDAASLSRLSRNLFELQSRHPRGCQWLPLLACWLADPPSPPKTLNPTGSGLADQSSKPETLPISDSPLAPSDSKAGAESSVDGVEQHSSGSILGSDTGKLEAVGTPGILPEEAAESTAETFAGAREGDDINQRIEHAFLLQEIAISLGFAPAALPSWDLFFTLYSKYEDQMKDIAPTTQVSCQLNKLADLYTAVSSGLQDWCIVSAASGFSEVPGYSRPAFREKNLLLDQRKLHPPALLLNKSDSRQQIQNQATDAEQDDEFELVGNPSTGMNEAGRGVPDSSEPEQGVPGLEGGGIPDIGSLGTRSPPWEEECDTLDSFCERLFEWLSSDKPEPQNASQSHVPLIPESLAEAMTYLRLAHDIWANTVQDEEGVLLGLVQSRYQNASAEDLENMTESLVEAIGPSEVENYTVGFDASRSNALKALRLYTDSVHLRSAGLVLFQLEAFIDAYIAQKAKSAYSVDLLPLMDSFIEVILDHTSPTTATPFLVLLFQQTRKVSQSEGKPTVRAVRQIMACLTADSGIQQDSIVGEADSTEVKQEETAAARWTEAAILLGSSLSSYDHDLSTQNALTAYKHCIEDVVSRLRSWRGCTRNAATELLGLFKWREYALAVLGQQTSEADTTAAAAAEKDVKAAELDTHSVADLLALIATLWSLDGGSAAAGAITEVFLYSKPQADFQYAGPVVQAYLHAWHYGAPQEEICAAFPASYLQNLPLPVVLEILTRAEKILGEEDSGPAKLPYHIYGALLGNASLVSQLLAPDSQECNLPGTYLAAEFHTSQASQEQPMELPAVVLVKVRDTRPPSEVAEGIVQACLAKALRDHGNGLEGAALNAEFNSVFTMIAGMVKNEEALVDWIWRLYQQTFSGFLNLASPQSGGAVVQSFQYFLACLSWTRATFHSSSPEGISELSQHLLKNDRVVLELLYKLDWSVVLDQLCNLDSTDSSLRRVANDTVVPAVLLLLQVAIMVPTPDLPEWMRQIFGLGPPRAGNNQVPSLPELLMSLDDGALKCLRDKLDGTHDNVPFLLQPLVTSPTLVQGDPAERVLHLLQLFSFAASASARPDLITLSIALTRSCLCLDITGPIEETATVEGLSSEANQSSDLSSPTLATLQGLCWHLTAAQHTEVVAGSLLPLLSQYANLDSGSDSGAAESTESGNLQWGEREAPDPSQGSHCSPVASTLWLLSDSAYKSLQADEIVPFANAESYLEHPQGVASSLLSQQPQPSLTPQDSINSHLSQEHGSQDTFWNKALQRLKVQTKTETKPDKESLQSAAVQLQFQMADSLLEECRSNPKLCLSVLKTLIATESLRTQEVPSYVAELLCVDVAQQMSGSNASQPGQNGDQLLTWDSKVLQEVLSGLDDLSLQSICAEASQQSSPLLQTLTSQALLARQPANPSDKTSWSIIATEAISWASRTQAREHRPADIVALWLSTLSWVGDSRWRGSQSVHPEVLEDLLNSMQGHTELLLHSLPLPDSSNSPGHASLNLVDTAAMKFKDVKDNWQNKQFFSRESRLEEEVPDPSIPGMSVQEQAALGILPDAAGQPREQPGRASQTFSRFGQRLKKLVDRPGPATQQPSSHTQDSLPKPRIEESDGGGIFTKARDRLKRGLAREPSVPKEQEVSQEEKDALHEAVALSLAAFAIQAYLKSVLCPSLSNYTPRVSQRGEGRNSSLQSSKDVLESYSTLSRSTSRIPGLHRHNISIASTLSTGGVYDEAAMREIDQLMEARTELDKLEEVQQHPLIQADWERWEAFFAAAPQMLSPATSVPAFQIQLIKLLLPKHLHLLCGMAPQGSTSLPDEA